MGGAVLKAIQAVLMTTRAFLKAIQTFLKTSEAPMHARYFLGLIVLTAACVEQVPAAGQFLDHQDAAADVAVGTDAAPGTDADAFTPDADAFSTDADVFVPDADAFTPHADAFTPDMDTIAPDIDTFALEVDASAIDADANALDSADPGDAVMDAAADSSAPDATPDAATDAAVADAAASDAVPDAAPDAAPDAETDAATGDVESDAAIADASAPDVAPDAAPDVGTDAATGDVESDVAEGTDAAIACVAANCDDANPCTDDGCDAANACVHLANAATCSDGNVCTVDDVCSDASCTPGTITTCDDGNACTTDGACDSVSGCTPVTNTEACDDGDACTSGDKCGNGACLAGSAVNCDDQNPCTTDSCAAGGCTHSNNSNSCSDGNFCTLSDTCQAGACSPGSAKTCTASGTCHDVGTCNPGTGVCSNPNSSDGTTCSDGNTCTLEDACVSGSCTGKPALWDKTYGTVGEDQVTSLVVTPDGSSYVLGGYTTQKGAGDYDFWLVWYAADGQQIWESTLGGVKEDWLRGMDNAKDGHFALVGYTYSYGTNGDLLIADVDAGGSMAFQHNFGGANSDAGNAVLYLADGTYLAAGYTASSGAGGQDGWLLHLDQAGNKTWDKTYGGTADDSFNALLQTSDGGYVAVGDSASGSAGDHDAWVVATDAGGNLIWQRRFGGAGADYATAISQAADGGFAIAGRTNSYGGNDDFWLIRLDKNGNYLWDKRYDSGGNDQASGIATLPGGYALTGWTDGKGSGDHDLWLLRTDLNGNRIGDKAFGGSARDYGAAIKAIGASNLVLAGATQSKGSGDYDFWALRMDDWGATTCSDSGSCESLTGTPCDDTNACTLDWCSGVGGCAHTNFVDGTGCEDGSNCTFGDTCKSGTCVAGLPTTWNKAMGVDYYAGISAVATSSAGYVFAGYAEGVDNVWMVPTDFAGNVGGNTSKGTEINYGGSEALYGVINSGSSYAFVGRTDGLVANNSNDGLLLITDFSTNTVQQQKVFGGNGYDQLRAITTRSSGLVMCGDSNSPGADSCGRDFWLVTTDASGNNPTQHWYQPANGCYEDCHGVVVAANGDIGMSGNTSAGGGLIVRADGNGNQLWAKTYSGLTGAGLTGIANYGTGFVAGGTKDFTGVGNQFWLMVVDSGGNLLWEKNYGGATSEVAYGFTAFGDGFGIVGKTNGYGADYYDGFVVRTDLYGNALWQRRLDDAPNASISSSNHEEVVNAIVQIPTGYLLAGNDDNKGWGDGWISRIDAWGNQTCAQGGSCGGKTLMFCDDGNPCTADTCDAMNSCKQTNLADGVVCGTGKSCTAGVCN
jgi:hypothetical protein